MQVLIRSASLYVLLNWLNGDNRTLFLPKATDVPFLIVAALQCFSLTSSTTAYQGKDVSCLGTAENHLEHNKLLLQLRQGLNLFHENNQSHRI